MAWSCDQYQEWVEREVREPVERQREERREKCRRKKCKKLCLCCNKWFCWIETFVYYFIEWLIRIILEWVVYIVCRILTAFITVLFYFWNIFSLGWLFRWVYCMFWGDSDLEKLPTYGLQLNVVIVHKDKKVRNVVTAAQIDRYISAANQILMARAKISVSRRGEIRETYSSVLWNIDASSSWSTKIGEYLKSALVLIGSDNPRYLTVYIVNGINSKDGLHQPLHGSVLIEAGSLETTLTHELGHAMLGFFNAYHNSNKEYLMFRNVFEMQQASGWNTSSGIPKLSRNERCTIRRSKWLNWSWVPLLV